MSQPNTATPRTEISPNTGRKAAAENAIRMKRATRSLRGMGKKEFMRGRRGRSVGATAAWNLLLQPLLLPGRSGFQSRGHRGSRPAARSCVSYSSHWRG